MTASSVTPQRRAAARLTFVVVWALASAASAASPAYQRRTAMIPMRDGTELYTEIHAPKGTREPLPFLLERTPYNARSRSKRLGRGSYRGLVRDGYIFVFQDIRGKYRSEGEFVMLREPAPNGGFDEGTDAWDTIEWLLANVRGHNGRVGMYGGSYGGWLTAMALVKPHPALRAASPQATPNDMFLGDDFFHNGAFRLSYGFEYSMRMESGRKIVPVGFESDDLFDWYLQLGPLANVEKQHAKGRIPTWTSFTRHPNYDAYWQKRRASSHIERVTVPTLHVGGWWDPEDFAGSLSLYMDIEKHDEQGLSKLVVGPWIHGSWWKGKGDKKGSISFGSPTAQYFRDEVLAPWLAHHLKDGPDPDLPEVLTFRSGANRWVRHDAWPPRQGVEHARLYLRADGGLSFEPPPADEGGFDSYMSNPAEPVPYRQRPIQPTYGRGSKWSTWLLADQRFLGDRRDVLSYQTEPLARDVTLSGSITANLFASTSGTDSDWIVKLIDVYPNDKATAGKMAGYQLMVMGEVMRARFRKSFETPEPLVPNEITAVTIGLHSQDYTFRRGHRIMVQVQSSWFPVIDRNPQTFVPNIFEAEAKDFQQALQRVYRSANHPSHVEVMVAKP